MQLLHLGAAVVLVLLHQLAQLPAEPVVAQRNVVNDLADATVVFGLVGRRLEQLEAARLLSGGIVGDVLRLLGDRAASRLAAGLVVVGLVLGWHRASAAATGELSAGR